MTTFKVGDRVRIRQWGDMAKQFGLDDDGDIQAKNWFTRGMRDLCGEEFTISRLEDGSVRGCGTIYPISTDMIEHANERAIAQPSTIQPGMLIRGLRNKYDVDTVLSVDADSRCVLAATKHSPGGVAQAIDGTEEVRWPWEETWTPIKPKHTPMRGDLFANSKTGATYMATESAVGLRLVCVIGNENEPTGYYWSHKSLFGDDDCLKYIGPS